MFFNKIFLGRHHRSGFESRIGQLRIPLFFRAPSFFNRKGLLEMKDFPPPGDVRKDEENSVHPSP